MKQEHGSSEKGHILTFKTKYQFGVMLIKGLFGSSIASFPESLEEIAATVTQQMNDFSREQAEFGFEGSLFDVVTIEVFPAPDDVTDISKFAIDKEGGHAPVQPLMINGVPYEHILLGPMQEEGFREGKTPVLIINEYAKQNPEPLSNDEVTLLKFARGGEA